jgi:signal transduction histidine kinase
MRPERTTEASLPIVWQAHFYETWWFYAAMVILAALAVWGAFWLYARQTQARYSLVLAERTRLAREMHDTVIQGCVGVSTLLEAARSMPTAAAARKSELVERAATQIRLTVNEAREAVWDLRHSDTDQTDPPTDLVETLKTFASQAETAEGIPVLAAVEGVPISLGNTADRNLLLVAREAIRNAVMHAKPSRIAVTLRFEPKEVTLEVADDGSGFTVDSSRGNAHYGIIGMRERVEQSGGAFQVVSSPEQGTHVMARIPLRNNHA